MICPNCKQEIDDGSIFFNNCAARVDNANEELNINNSSVGTSEQTSSVEVNNVVNNSVDTSNDKESKAKKRYLVLTAFSSFFAICSAVTRFSDFSPYDLNIMFYFSVAAVAFCIIATIFYNKKIGYIMGIIGGICLFVCSNIFIEIISILLIIDSVHNLRKKK